MTDAQINRICDAHVFVHEYVSINIRQSDEHLNPFLFISDMICLLINLMCVCLR